MSNLGLYQTMTKAAKKVGGPINLAICVGLGGYTIIRTGEAGIKTFVRYIRRPTVTGKTNSGKIIIEYSVKKKGVSNEGVVFNEGDTFKVLERAKDTVLIEKVGDLNNPYFVSSEFLQSISDFKSI